MKAWPLLMILLAMTVTLIGCSDDEDSLGGLGASEDIGVYCEQLCSENWCEEVNHGDCTSHLCVGPEDDYYCTDFCLNDASCPEGYLCTDVCSGIYEEPYCVRESDYDTLVALDYCDAKE